MTIDPTAALSSLAPYVGAGGLLTALAYAALAIARKALPSLADARLKRAEAAKLDADARKTRAEAKRMETQNDGAQVQRGIVDAGTIAAALDEMREMRAEYEALRKRLDDCEKKHRESDAEIERLRGEVRTLRREMERRGWTPPGGFAPPKETA